MDCRFKHIFGGKPKGPTYFYPMMYGMNIKNNFEALVIEWAIRYLNEQMGISLHNITPPIVQEIAQFATRKAYSIR